MIYKLPHEFSSVRNTLIRKTAQTSGASLSARSTIKQETDPYLLLITAMVSQLQMI